jgi:anaerobic magnesium-protoporphyrin IX monomethyl ester cyclase
VVEQEKGIEVEIVDANAELLSWHDLENYIETYEPDVVGASGIATCNTYTVARTMELAKQVGESTDKEITTVVGGQHFTAMVEESLTVYPEIDFIVRGEGDLTFPELCKAIQGKRNFVDVKGISFMHNGEIISTPPRPLVENLDTLPSPAFHLLDISKYHAKIFAPNQGYGNIEDSRGCPYNCTFCTEWTYWKDPINPERGCWRGRSIKRIVDEMQYCYENHGVSFFWLTGDNVIYGNRTKELSKEILARNLEIEWFIQARADAVIQQQETIPLMKKAGNNWTLLGVESYSQDTLKSLHKNLRVEQSVEATRLLQKSGQLAQGMIIIGHRSDTHESIQQLRDFVNNELQPDIALYTILTPYPGSPLYELADKNGWIEDRNYSHYDMVTAVMPTETLSRKEIQQELYDCYNSSFGSWSKRITGLFSKSKIKRRIWRHMATAGVMGKLKNLI